MELSYSLVNYGLSRNELATFCFVSPYAQRHYAWYQYNGSKVHQYIAFAEYLPILGPILSVAEATFVKINDYFAFYGLEYETPPIDEEIEDRVMRVVLKKIPNFEELEIDEQFSKLLGEIRKFDLPDRIDEWNDKKFIKGHDKKMRLLWKFSEIAHQIVDQAAQSQLEEGEDIRTRRAKVYANQMGIPRMFGHFFEMPRGYEEARACTAAARRSNKGRVTAETSLDR